MFANDSYFVVVVVVGSSLIFCRLVISFFMTMIAKEYSGEWKFFFFNNLCLFFVFVFENAFTVFFSFSARIISEHFLIICRYFSTLLSWWRQLFLSFLRQGNIMFFFF